MQPLSSKVAISLLMEIPISAVVCELVYLRRLQQRRIPHQRFSWLLAREVWVDISGVRLSSYHRDEGHLDLLGQERLPVNSLEKGMRFDFLHV